MAHLIESVGVLWWELIAISAIKASVLLFIIGWLASAMSRRSPAARHNAWAVGLMGAALLPALSRWTPIVLTLPEWMDVRSLTSSTVAVDVGGSSLWAQWAVTTAILVLAGVWAAGCLYRVIRSLAATWLLVCWKSQSRAADPRVQRICDHHRRTLSISRPVQVLSAPGDVIPMTWGIVRPKLLLPNASRKWSEQRLRTVMVHELAHIRRGDGLYQWLVQAVQALYWFHPMVRAACERMRWEREAACDDIVLASGVLPTEYAEDLLALSHPRSAVWRETSIAVAMAEPHALESRIREILSANRWRSSLPWSQAFAGVAIIVLSLGLLAGSRPGARAPAGARVHELGTGRVAVQKPGENLTLDAHRPAQPPEPIEAADLASRIPTSSMREYADLPVSRWSEVDWVRLGRETTSPTPLASSDQIESSEGTPMLEATPDSENAMPRQAKRSKPRPAASGQADAIGDVVTRAAPLEGKRLVRTKPQPVGSPSI